MIFYHTLCACSTFRLSQRTAPAVTRRKEYRAVLKVIKYD